ncbi:MAG: hypothetical protein V4714_15870 [Bacteroidota bacterium]
MKKTIRLFIVILLAITVGFLAYHWWKSRQPTDAWVFIPDHAALILEVKSPLDWLKANQAKPSWITLASLPYSRTLLQRLDSLQAVGRTTDHSIEDFLHNKQVTISVHLTARDDFDYLFYVPLSGLSEPLWLDEWIKKFQQNPAYQTNAHSFQGLTITEIKANQQNNLVFSYIIHQNYFIGSYTPFLVEDAVRTIGNKNLLSNRWDEMKRPAQLITDSEGTVQVHINMARMGQWASVFTTPDQVNYFQNLSYLAQSGLFSLQSDKEQIRLNGRLYTHTGEQEADWLDIFKDQPARAMRLTNLIPNEATVLYHWGFEDARRLRDALARYNEKHDSTTIRRQVEVREKYGVRLNLLYDWVGREMAMSLLETNEATANRLIFVEAKDLDKAISQLSDLTLQVDRRNNSMPYVEHYAGTTIRQIGIPELPACVFGSLFEGFPQCFYTSLKGHIIFSNQISPIKKLLDDVAAGNVWNNSVKQKTLLQQTSPEANFSMFVNTTNAWSLFLQNVSPHWRELLTANSPAVRSFEQVALQVIHRSNFYETTLSFHHPHDQALLAAENQFLINQRVKFESPVRTPPFIVKNAEDQSNEMLVQDEANALHFISSAGKKIGKKALNSPIVSEIYQVDVFNNGELQFAFATKQQLHLIDRKGVLLTGFPVSLPDSAQLQTMSVVDYDKSKDYRFAVSDTQGNIYMFDKAGNLLDGWKPKSLGYGLSAPVQHVRVRDRDYLIAAQTNGAIQVLNRKGESYPNFPIQLNTKLSSPVVVTEGISSETTLLTTITPQGELLQVDLDGKVKRREQLYRPDRETTFQLCSEAHGKGWAILRQSETKIALLGNPPSIFFEKDTESSRRVWCQYYDFGTNRNVFALTFPDQQQTILYEANGKMIGNRAIESQFPVGIKYSEAFHKLLIYRASRYEAGIWTVKVR